MRGIGAKIFAFRLDQALQDRCAHECSPVIGCGLNGRWSIEKRLRPKMVGIETGSRQAYPPSHVPDIEDSAHEKSRSHHPSFNRYGAGRHRRLFERHGSFVRVEDSRVGKECVSTWIYSW